jgi:hypothetical protein
MFTTRLGKYTAFIAQWAFRGTATFLDIDISSESGMIMHGSNAAVDAFMRAKAGFETGQKTGQHEQLLDEGWKYSFARYLVFQVYADPPQSVNSMEAPSHEYHQRSCKIPFQAIFLLAAISLVWTYPASVMGVKVIPT